MDTMKPESKKQTPPAVGQDEERVYALYFHSQVDMPLSGVNGGTKKIVATESRTITRQKDGRYRIVETYLDKRPTVVLYVPAAMAICQTTPVHPS